MADITSLAATSSAVGPARIAQQTGIAALKAERAHERQLAGTAQAQTEQAVQENTANPRRGSIVNIVV
ncbi:MAG TPA: hypothetical protein VHL08_09165 [Dongiaceae bacterium]|jgi:hypothetical protein|nr:hypothetical protein [Dongiaceae bacterium]